MDIKHITSDTLRSLLGLTDKKDQLIKSIEEVENEIGKAFKGVATMALDVVEDIVPPKHAKKSARPAVAKPVKRKRTMSREGRARISAAAKARWAARKAGKPAAKVGKPAKKGFKLSKTA